MYEIISTFVFVTIAALPGRTTFILLLLGSTAKHSVVLIGSMLAFVAQCAIAVVVGQFLKSLPHAYVQAAAGLLFLYFAWKFWAESKSKESAEDLRSAHSVGSIFTLFFLAELGDVSQLAIASRAVGASSLLEVFVGSALAMCLIALVAVFAGRPLRRFAKPATLQKIAAAFFLVLGIYLVATMFRGL